MPHQPAGRHFMDARPGKAQDLARSKEAKIAAAKGFERAFAETYVHRRDGKMIAGKSRGKLSEVVDQGSSMIIWTKAAGGQHSDLRKNDKKS